MDRRITRKSRALTRACQKHKKAALFDENRGIQSEQHGGGRSVQQGGQKGGFIKSLAKAITYGVAGPRGRGLQGSGKKLDYTKKLPAKLARYAKMQSKKAARYSGKKLMKYGSGQHGGFNFLKELGKVGKVVGENAVNIGLPIAQQAAISRLGGKHKRVRGGKHMRVRGGQKGGIGPIAATAGLQLGLPIVQGLLGKIF